MDQAVSNPAALGFEEVTEAATSVLDTGTALPFEGQSKTVDSVMPDGATTDVRATFIHDLPWAQGEQGADLRSVNLNWSTPVKGRVRYQVRMDNTD